MAGTIAAKGQTLAYGALPLTPSVPSPVEPGDVIAEKYRVDSILGVGGMGVVVGATHLQLERRIAIKFMLPFEMDELGIRRFMQEARAAARIQCEHVARVLDVASLPDGAPYIVMEYLEGESLDHVLRQQDRIPIAETVEYILQACEAIAEAHVAGIVHRDLKPGNLFRCRRADGSPLIKVFDFGVSKLLPRPGFRKGCTTQPHSVVGSPLYLSPEQLRSPLDVDARADIWALGAILYELVVGTSPFFAEEFPDICANILTGPVRPVHELLPDVPAGFDAVIAQSLERDPAKRFQSVADFAEALTPFAPFRAQLSVERIARVVRGLDKTERPRSLESSLRRLRLRLEKVVSSRPDRSPPHAGGLSVRDRAFVQARPGTKVRWAVAGGALALLALFLASFVLTREEKGPRHQDLPPAPTVLTPAAAPAIPSGPTETPATSAAPVTSSSATGAAPSPPSPAEHKAQRTPPARRRSPTSEFGGLL